MSLIRSTLITAIGVAAVYVSATNNLAESQELTDHARASRLPPVLVVERQSSRLVIAGDVRSAAHQARILNIAESFMPGAVITTEMQIRTPLPAGWALVTELVLRVIGEMHSSTAYVDEQQIFMRGFTTDLIAWQTATSRLEKHLLPGMRIRYDVEELKVGASFEDQCRQLFISASAGWHVTFHHASDEISSNAFSHLDELIQIAADCPAATITITGHTDDSGDERANKYLSKTRADAVISYMAARGIAAQRLRSRGAGSSSPLVTEDNAQARALNRRIEFGISFSE